MGRSIAVGLLLHDEFHLQETGVAVLEVGALGVYVVGAHGSVFPDVPGNADVLIETGVAGFREGGGIHFMVSVGVGLEERHAVCACRRRILPVEVLRERGSVGIGELVHPVEGGAAAEVVLEVHVGVVVACGIALADGNDAFRGAALVVGVAVGKTVIPWRAVGCARNGIHAGWRCLYKGVETSGGEAVHEFIGGCLCPVPEPLVVGLAIADILAHAFPVCGGGVPGSVGVEGGGSGKAQDAEFKAYCGGFCEAAVFGGNYAPGQVCGGFVAHLDYKVDGFGKSAAGEGHFVAGLNVVLDKRDAAHVTDHVGIGDGYAQLSFGLLLCEFGRAEAVGVRGNAVCVLQEEPGVTYCGIVFFGAEAVGFAARRLAGYVGSQRTGVIEVVGAVALGVLVGHEVVRDGLQDVPAHLAVEVGDKAVRQVVVGRSKDFVGVLQGREEGVYGGTGCLRSLAQAGVAQFEAFARCGTCKEEERHRQYFYSLFHGAACLECDVDCKVEGLDQRVGTVGVGGTGLGVLQGHL